MIMLGDRILVEPIEKAEGAILIPDAVDDGPQSGKVLDVGGGLVGPMGKEPLEVLVGDVVLYNKGTGLKIKDEGKALLIMREFEVLAVGSRVVRPLAEKMAAIGCSNISSKKEE